MFLSVSNNFMGLPAKIEETLKSSDLKNVSQELTEIVIDGFLEEGIIKEIPILGSIIGIGKGVMNISDRLFTKKLLLFILEIKDLTPVERNVQISKIQRDSDYQNSIGEKLLMIVDKCNDSTKASLLGKLFLCTLKNELTYKDFIRCAEIINNASLNSLLEVIRNNHTGIPIDQEDDMVSSGLFKFEPPKIELLKSENTYQQIREGSEPIVNYHIKEIDWSATITYHGKLIRDYLKNCC